MSKKNPQALNSTGYRKLLISNLKEIAHRNDLWSVWSDFVEMASISISNSVDLSHKEAREAQYLNIAKRYTSIELNKFSEALGALVMSLELAGFDDVLGSVFMELELGSKWAGQFFTPYSVCKLMALMQVGDSMTTKVQENGFVTANDPCTGGGAMSIALAEAMHDAGINYQQHLHVVAQDIDIKAVHMTYLQLSLLHVPAVVIHGNSLSSEKRSHWFTPAHVIGGWSRKLRQQIPAEQEKPVTRMPMPSHQTSLFEEAA